MRKALTLSIIICFIAVVAYLTKPSEKQCMNKITKEFKSTKLSYAAETLPSGINRDAFAETAEKAFLQSIEIKDRFLYREFYQGYEGNKKRVGWAAFSWVNVELK